VPCTIASLASVCGDAFEECLRSSVSVGADGMLALEVYSGMDVATGALLQKSFDDGRLVRLGSIVSKCCVHLADRRDERSRTCAQPTYLWNQSHLRARGSCSN
jgi:hypothetical protein